MFVVCVCMYVFTHTHIYIQNDAKIMIKVSYTEHLALSCAQSGRKWSEFLSKPNSPTVVRRADWPRPLYDYDILHSERRWSLLWPDAVAAAAASDNGVLLHKLGAGTRCNAPS